MLIARSASKGPINYSVEHTDTIDDPKFVMAEFIYKDSGTCVELGMFIREDMTKEQILHTAIKTLSDVDHIAIRVSHNKTFEEKQPKVVIEEDLLTAKPKKESLFERLKKIF